MIEFTNGGRLVETVGELPHFDSVRVLYADFETTSHDPKKKSVNPWHDCWVAGLAVTVNDVFGAWYIPTRHVFGPCLPEEIVIEWWFDLVNRAELWVNSNIKYDAHVSANALGVIPTCPLYDIITHMKIIDSDRALKGGYGLDMLSKQILGEDISRYENALQPYLNKNKDYGRIPADICGEYACQDVITARRLHKFIEQTRPEDSASVAAIELELTGVLYGIERTGMCVDEIELAVEEIAVCNELITLDQRLARLVGRTINPISGDDCFDVLCNQYGLPVVAWTEEDDEDTGEKQGNPSFNKHVWPVYLQHPYAPKEIVQCIFEYRTLSHFRSLFLKQYQQLRFTDGRLHSDYNQCVSTGRMGCKKPNAQQLSKRAKKLIHPPPGFAFLSQDQSQIEFRVIADYIEAWPVINAYIDNPDTDFHEWVAESAGMARKPAKTMNFMMGYGGGKKKAVKTLKAVTSVIGNVKIEVDRLVAEGAVMQQDALAVFDRMCESKAERVYDNYHATLPSLKSTAREAMEVCKARGYIRNRFGRRRHLPRDASHKAFNSLCQGFAADIQKERTVAMARAIRGTPIQMVANVHDETLSQAPVEVLSDRRTQVAMSYLLERPNVEMRVPLRVSTGYSTQHWCEASTDKKDGGPGEPLVYSAEERKWLESHKDDPLYFLK